MSAKWRMVLWFTLMMLLLAGVTLTFVLVMNGSVIANPTSQVVREVSRRADDIEFDNGTFDWDDMKEYKHGVYCTYYDTGGRISAAPCRLRRRSLCRSRRARCAPIRQTGRIGSYTIPMSI